MNSTIPPSTIVAWNSMMSGKDTSEIGVFSYTYKDEEGNSRLVSSKNIKCRLLWDLLGEQNKKSIALYVPLSYPPHHKMLPLRIRNQLSSIRIYHGIRTPK